MREYKNIIVTVTGDVYRFETATIPPSVWFDAHELTWSDVTMLQGAVFTRIRPSQIHDTRYPNADESTMDALYDYIHKSKDDYVNDTSTYGDNDYQLTRTVIEQHGGNFYEFLALALEEGAALNGEFVAVHATLNEAYDVFLMDRYGVDSDSEIFLYGLAELDMDAVSEQYDADSGNVLLHGSDVVYEVMY